MLKLQNNRLISAKILNSLPTKSIKRTLCNKSSNNLAQGYVPSVVEKQEHECTSYFTPPPRPTTSDPFTMILPPPNITGVLHLGHTLTATIQDVIIRWKRMQGIRTLWIPGLDHAGIATQVMVEKKLWKERKKTRHEIGREQFEQSVWQFKHDKAKTIESQLRQLGASLDWSRGVFTMDEGQSEAVTAAFVRLFDQGLIYREDSLVNWSCVLRSAISDIEVEYLNVEGATRIDVPGYDGGVEVGKLYFIAYKLSDGPGEVVVATTRPETMIGDVAVAVNPRDSRYSHLIGKGAWHPFRNVTIPIVADDFVDPEFGTGAVKITPAHDPIDFSVAKRHALPSLPVIDETGHMTALCPQFSNLPRFEARSRILTQLSHLNLLHATRDHKMQVPICSRSRDIVESLLKPQWFLNCDKMARNAMAAVQDGRLLIEPRAFEKTWCHWLENIRPWCISRQLWWGHRVPAYLCQNLTGDSSARWVAAESSRAAVTKAAGLFSTSDSNVKVLEQDGDVLDTWFSSALLPFTCQGWPRRHLFRPLDLMETGHDIIFFWVARMSMLCKHLTGVMPFDRVLLHGLLCDSGGRKMSKSLGNVIAPEDVITGASLEVLEEKSRRSFDQGVLTEGELARALEGQKRMFGPEGVKECGADALRFTLLGHDVKSHFVNFDVQVCHTNKLFCNKIWQATKYTLANIQTVERTLNKRIEDFEAPIRDDTMDSWILSRLCAMVRNVEDGLNGWDFHICTSSIKTFLYYEFCDIYLETTKRALRDSLGSPQLSQVHCHTLLQCLEVSLRTLAPFMPRLCQHLHTNLPQIHRTLYYPTSDDFDTYRDESLENKVGTLRNLLVSIRRLKRTFNVSSKLHRTTVFIENSPEVPARSELVLSDLSGCQEVVFVAAMEESGEDKVSDCVGAARVHLTVPEELRRAVQLDLPKLESKRVKLVKELSKLEKMVLRDNSSKISMIRDKIERIDYIRSVCTN